MSRSIVRRFQACAPEAVGGGGHPLSSVLDASADFPDPGSGVLIIEDKIVEQNGPSDVRDLASRNDCKPSVLLCIHELCQTNGFLVLADVRSV